MCCNHERSTTHLNNFSLLEFFLHLEEAHVGVEHRQATLGILATTVLHLTLTRHLSARQKYISQTVYFPKVKIFKIMQQVIYFLMRNIFWYKKVKTFNEIFTFISNYFSLLVIVLSETIKFTYKRYFML